MRFLTRDAAAVLGLMAVTALVRILCLRTIDLGGDATFKWFFVRSWPYANKWVFDHHTARFSINAWIWLVQRLFGTHPNGMYVAPLLAAVAQVPWLYACGRALGTRAGGVLACSLLLPFAPALDASSQLLPGVFQATYELAALHALLVFASEPEAHTRQLWFCGAWLFVGYLAMVTTVYVLPGVVVAAWLVRRSPRDVARVLGALLGLLALETLCYALFSPYPFGQFQLILHTHNDVKPTGFWGLFGRFAALSRDWQGALLVWLVCGLLWLTLRRTRQPSDARSAGSYALWLVPTSVLTGMTFGIKGWNPIVPATDFSVRYFDVLTPLIALPIGCTLSWLAQRFTPVHWLRYAHRGQLASVALATALALAWYRPAGAHALAVNDAQWRALNDAFARGLPIVGTNRSDHLQMKTLVCVQWGYLTESELLQDGELRLHALGKTRLGNHTHRYLSRVPLESDAVARALKTQHCLVTVARRDGEPKLALELFDAPDCRRMSP